MKNIKLMLIAVAGFSVGLGATDSNVDATTKASTEATTSFVDEAMKTATFASMVVSNMYNSVETELYNTFNDHVNHDDVCNIKDLVVEDSYIKTGYKKAKGLTGDVLFEADSYRTAHPYAIAGIVVGIVTVTAGSVYAYQQYSKNDTEVKNS